MRFHCTTYWPKKITIQALSMVVPFNPTMTLGNLHIAVLVTEGPETQHERRPCLLSTSVYMPVDIQRSISWLNTYYDYCITLNFSEHFILAIWAKSLTLLPAKNVHIVTLLKMLKFVPAKLKCYTVFILHDTTELATITTTGVSLWVNLLLDVQT